MTRGRSRHARPAPANPGPSPQTDEPVSLQLIADKLDRLVWRRRPMGVDEQQVWHVIRRLDEMYRQLYREQEVRYQALLEQAQWQTPPRRQPTPPKEATPPRMQPHQPRQQAPTSSAQPRARHFSAPAAADQGLTKPLRPTPPTPANGSRPSRRS